MMENDLSKMTLMYHDGGSLEDQNVNTNAGKTVLRML